MCQLDVHKKLFNFFCKKSHSLLYGPVELPPCVCVPLLVEVWPEPAREPNADKVAVVRRGASQNGDLHAGWKISKLAKLKRIKEK